MDETDRPPLGPYAYEEIAKRCHELEKSFWDALSKMRVERPFAIIGPTKSSPTPPKLPEHLRQTIQQYAGAIFRIEAAEYPAAPEIEFWLAKLAERVVERIMETVEVMDQTTHDIFHGKQYNGLSWHGLTLEDMRDAAREGLEYDKTSVMSRLLPASVVDASSQGESAPTPESIDASMPTASEPKILIERRKKLLDEYKAATGEPSSKRIYESSNAKIHKPEFYEWLRGTLPESSRVTKRFEAFLTAKRRPIPRNSTS
jgi:hypothetical protein